MGDTPSMSEGLSEENRKLLAAARVGPTHTGWYRFVPAQLNTLLNAARSEALLPSHSEERNQGEVPIPMVLHCPKCGLQHIDAEDDRDGMEDFETAPLGRWTNPPHRSHLCHGCGHIWRPADVPTEGVARIATKGKADSPIVSRQSDQGEVDRLRKALEAGVLRISRNGVPIFTEAGAARAVNESLLPAALAALTALEGGE